MFSESDLLPLSGLQHFSYCERQWALIHLERIWAEDRHTAEGRVVHEHAHEADEEARHNVRISTGLHVHSLTLGLSGQCDVVEFPLPAGPPYPVEYKRGRPKTGDWDRMQLCAQALCLEEMLHCTVSHGALFYHQVRRRVDVEFDPGLRTLTGQTARSMHEAWGARRTAPPFDPSSVEARRCRSCSLHALCLPDVLAKPERVRTYLRSGIRYALKETQCESS